jgi:hypothetical protein
LIKIKDRARRPTIVIPIKSRCEAEYRGPIDAFLAEFFPGRIRYTAVSMPYMIGNGWGGGFVPFIITAAYQATGSLAYALIYPIAVPAVCFSLSLSLSLFLMPETAA